MSLAAPNSFAAGSCAFEAQHYRPQICRLCFQHKEQHAPQAQAQPQPQPQSEPQPQAKLRSQPLSTSASASTPQSAPAPQQQAQHPVAPRQPDPVMQNAAAVAAKPTEAQSAVSASHSSVSVPASQLPSEVPAGGSHAAVTVTASADVSNDGPSASEQPNSSAMLQLKHGALASMTALLTDEDATAHSARQQQAEQQQSVSAIDLNSASEAGAEDDAAESAGEGEDHDEAADAVPTAPPLVPTAAAAYTKSRSSVIVGSSSTTSEAVPDAPSFSSTSSPARQVSDRQSMLRSIEQRPRLRRASEHRALPEHRAPVVDLNSELTWAIRKKGRRDPAAAAADKAATALPEQARQFLTALADRYSRADAAGPASLDRLSLLESERADFVSRHANTLGAAASALEQVEPSWPAVRAQMIVDALQAEQRMRAAITNVQRYTQPFEAHKLAQRQQQQQQQRSRPSSSVASSASCSNSSSSSDWLVVEAGVLQRSLQSLVRCVEELRKLQRDSDGVINIDLNAALSDGSSASSSLIDVLLEKAALACAAFTPSQASGEPNLKAADVGLFSRTSKAVRSFQTLTLALDLFDQLARASPPIVHLSFEQREKRDELAAIRRQVESSDAHRASCAVAARKGQWDKKEEVVLRSTSAPIQRGAATASAAAAVSGGADLIDLKAQHPRLFELLEVKNQEKQSQQTQTQPTPAVAGSSLAPAFSQVEREAELRPLLRALVSEPLAAITRLLVRIVIPAHDTLALRLVLSDLFLPARSDQGEWLQCAAAVLHECVAKVFTAGVRMCIRRHPIDAAADDAATDAPNSPEPNLDLDANIRGPGFDGVGGGGNTALHIAAAAHNIDLMQLLIRAGADPLAINSYERVAIFPLRSLFAASAKVTPASGVAAISVDASDARPTPAPGVSSMARYLKSSRLSDVRLCVQVDADGSEVVIPAHRLVLCAQSEVFRAMLETDSEAEGECKPTMWAEGMQIAAAAGAATTTVAAIATGAASAPSSSIGNGDGSGGGLDDDDGCATRSSVFVSSVSASPLVHIGGVPSVGAFDVLLAYLYSGGVEFLRDDLWLASGALELATRFMVAPLRALLQEHVAARINAANIDSVYNLALHTASTDLQRRVERRLLDEYAAMLAARPALADTGFGGGDPAQMVHHPAPHPFLLRVLGGLDAAKLVASQGNNSHTRWRK